jgi:hypothetical protein
LKRKKDKPVDNTASTQCFAIVAAGSFVCNFSARKPSDRKSVRVFSPLENFLRVSVGILLAKQ